MGLRASKLLVWLLILTLVSSSFGAMTAMAAEISSLVLNKNELTLEVGSTVSLTATAVFDTGSTENVTVKTDWNSGAADIASVYAGAVTAKKEGKAVITATYLGKTVIVNVTVTKRVRSLIKDKQTIDLRKGKEDQVTLTAYYDDGTSEDVTTKAEWNIDNGQVATVVNGKVTGQSSGTAVITAKYNNQTVSIPVSIEIVKRVDAEKSKLSLLINPEGEQVKLFATYPDGTKEEVSAIADWESDNPEVADVLKGTITGYGPGQANITATYGTKSTTIKVDVDNAIKLSLGKETVLLKKNESEQLELKATYAEGNTEVINDRAEWSSSNDAVVSVVKGKLFAIATGEATITAKYGQKSVTVVVDVDVPRRLEPNKDSLDMKSGEEEALEVRATFADGKNEEVTSQAKWSSDNEAVASVVSGKVIAHKAGEATITATYGEKSVTIKVSVDIPIMIKPNESKISFQLGSYEKLTLNAIYKDKTVDVTELAEWTSSAPDIAGVSKGTITGVGTGTATITAKYGTRTTTIQVSVGVLKSLTSSTQTNLSLQKGDKVTLDLTATYTDGTEDKNAGKDAEWTSSNSKVATVDAGIVTGVASGEATITASFSSKTITFTVQVDMADKLSASPTFLNFDLGETKTITLNATDASGTPRDVTGDAEWTSSNAAIATVDKGVVTPVARGKVTITAKYGGKSVSISVEIGVVQQLDVDRRFITTKSGSSVQIVLTATLSDGSKKDVSSSAQWKSSNYKIADVAEGLVTGVSAGNATISASFGGKSVGIPVEIDKLKYLKTDVVTLQLKQGETAEVKATATFDDLSEEDVTIPSLWTSTNIRVVDVKDGIIKATGKGKATVTVTYAKKKTTVVVVVS
ncbi:hypothetical protein DVH26_34290 [Paenibacillus sp. H1-7]|nr:hypothetical protein DVH26_34290 [Paenibacillus sp. H1-7]